MFKNILVASLLLFSLFMPAYAVPQVQADGSILFSPQDIKDLQLLVNQKLDQVWDAGIEEGAKQAIEILKNNPKMCPKNI